LKNIKPDYRGGSIVNLVSSISSSFGKEQMYRELSILPASSLKKNVILVIIDGLGYEFLTKRAPGSFLASRLLGKMTSVFPSTTAAAITSYVTGVAPKQHALTGWFVYMKEVGAVVKVLPYNLRIGGPTLEELGIDYGEVMSYGPFFSGIKARKHMIMDRYLLESAYNRQTMEGTTGLSYTSLKGFFRRIIYASKLPGRKLIYAYWPAFDTVCHELGAGSDEALRHFAELDRGFQSISLKNTSVIVSADHGLIDCKTILLEDYPRLKSCLSVPLCGEGRCPYCYVKPGMMEEFERQAAKIPQVESVRRSGDLVKEGFFGFGKADPRFVDRIGDYVLFMKDGYVIRDSILGQRPKILFGNHGGLSREEMLVPVIVL